jgi:hypothetical protein
MRRIIRRVSLATVFIHCLGGAAYAAVTMERICVRVYDSAKTAVEDRDQALKRAGDILAGADVSVDWRDCSTRAVLKHPACSSAPSPGEIVVRLVHHPATDGSRALGEALVNMAGGRGVLATVFVDRIEAVAAIAKTDFVAFVGRVIAHEIGHLLLGTNSHTGRGLMREVWSLKDLARNRTEDWLFSRADVDRMRQARRSS